MNKDIEEQIGLFEALQTEQEDAAKTTEDKKKADAAAAKWARAHAVEVERQAKAAKELQDAYFGAIDALAIFRGEDFDLSIAIDGTKELHTELGRLASEVVGLVEPLTQMEFLLGGASDMVAGMGLMSGAQSEIKKLQESYSELAALPLGFESEVEHLQDMHVALAKAVTMVDLLAQKGEGIPAGVREMVSLLEQEIEGKTWELDAKVNAEAIPTLEANQLWIDELLADAAEVKQIKADRLDAFASTVGTVSGLTTSLTGGDLFGAVGGGLSATGNPHAMAAGAVVEAFGGIAELGELAKDSSVAAVTRELIKSAEQTMQNFRVGLEIFKQVLPEIVSIVITEMPGAIITAIPDIMAAFYLAMVDALGQLWGWIKAFFGSKEKRQEWAQEGREAWGEWFADVVEKVRNTGDSAKEEGYESFASGSAKIGRTGLALLHRGEAVIPAGGRRAMTANGGGGGTVNINISTAIMDRDVIPRLVREIDRAVGKYGRTSAAFAGG